MNVVHPLLKKKIKNNLGTLNPSTVQLNVDQNVILIYLRREYK